MSNSKLKIEQECMIACVASLSKLAGDHRKRSSPDDSVAEANAKRAMRRVLCWLVSFIEETGAE